MNMDINERFHQAVADSKELHSRPSNEVLLQLYGLYKQSTEGDASPAAEPNAFDFVAKAKFNAWMQQSGKPKEQAMEEYVQLVEKLK